LRTRSAWPRTPPRSSANGGLRRPQSRDRVHNVAEHPARGTRLADEAIRELELFYEAGWRAGDVLHAILDQPRCLGGLAADRIEDAAGVFDWDVQAVAHHVRDRRPVDRDEADARRRILLDWYSKVNDPPGEVAFARELIATRGNEA
jgi:hypothetical protein